MSPMARAELQEVLGLTLTDEQWDCVSAPMRPEVIVAGAGTGKTTVMAARVLWLVASGLVAEQEVLGLTFTNKAAAQLAHRVSTLLQRWRAEHPGDADLVGEPTIATYHSFARRLLDEQGLRLGIEPGARLLSAAAVAQLAHRVVCRAEGLSAARHAPSRIAADLIALDANLAEQAISTDELRAHDRSVVAEVQALTKPKQAIKAIGETARRRIELADLVDELRAERVRAGGLDFADHMRLCVDLVRSSPELVETMRAGYRVILLDEYQDTSIAQRIILSTLFAGAAVTAVGDPLQAIYGWRSASVANIAAFGTHFAGGPEVRVLSVNRRSGEPILAAANRVARQLRGQHPEVAPLRPPPPVGEARAGRMHARGVRAGGVGAGQVRAGEVRPGEVRAALLTTITEEREWLADQVAALVAAGRAPEQIAVLGRTNDSLGPLRDALVARGVPASVTGAAALEASPAAAAVLATLRLLADPADNTAAVALLAGPRWRIGPADLEALARRAADLVDPSGQGAIGRAGRGRGRAATPSTAGDAAARGVVAGAGGGAGGGTAAGRQVAGATITVTPDGLQQRLAEAVAVEDPVQRPSLLEAAFDPGLRVTPEAADRLATFVAEIRHLQGHIGESLADLTARVVQVIDAQVEADLAADQAARAIAAFGPPGAVPATAPVGDVGLDGLLQLVDGFSDADGRSGLGAFLAYLDAAEQLGSGEQVDLPAQPGAVALMTIHQAKGLEFPVVVLPHLCKDVFPSKRGSERWTTQAQVVPSELRDDRHVLPALTGFTSKEHVAFVEACRAHDRSGDDRLAYVAITRAEELLIAAGHWWGPSQKGLRGPSPYLEQLHEEALANAGALFAVGEPWADRPTCDEPDATPSNPLLAVVHEVPWPVAEPGPDDPVVRAARAVEELLSRGPAGELPSEGVLAAAAASAEPNASVPTESIQPAPVEPIEAATAEPVEPPTGEPVEPALAEPIEPAPVEPVEPALAEPIEPATAEPVEPPTAEPEESAAAAPMEPPSGWVAEQIAQWDEAIEALLARTSDDPGSSPPIRLPEVLTASAAVELVADPRAYAQRLARPMPRRRSRTADLGTAFHAWVEARLGLQPLITDDELPGAADEGIASAAELADLKESFERLPYAARQPFGLEVPFSVSLGGRVLRGRIDAVFPAGPDSPDGIVWEVVDWKTTHDRQADPLQLTIYRVAWAEQAGVPVDQVGAAFAFVRSASVVRPIDLPDAARLAELLAGEGVGERARIHN